MMTLDEKLLEDARALRERSVDAQYEAERTALAYQHAIRKLHAAGGSLREIAEALGLSHQRVHQIVDADSGKTALKEDPAPHKGRGKPRRCSFCGRPQADVQKLIAGPARRYICDECVALAVEAIASQQGAVNSHTEVVLHHDLKKTCSFCGKKARQVDHLVVAPFHDEERAAPDTVQICNECVELCREILGEERDRPKK